MTHLTGALTVEAVEVTELFLEKVSGPFAVTVDAAELLRDTGYSE